MSRDDRRVLVVGAGLAGLCCALHLQRRGIAVQILEAGDAPGGVVRTDEVEGFRLDRGFQVYPSAYPEARAMLDHGSLRLHPFRAGALIRFDGRFRRVGDPLRHPLDAWPTLASGLVTPGDAWRVLRLRGELRRRSLEEILTRPATSTREAWRRRGFSRRFVRGFLEPFFRGVFLEPDLQTTSRMFEFTFRTFAGGAATLPARGMAALPGQLAARLAPGSLRLSSPVASVDEDGAALASGAHVEARAVVVAGDAAAAARLLPELEEPAWCATTCFYYAAERPAVPGPWLLLNADGGRVSHLCFPSEVAPELAPPGRSLVSVSVLGCDEPGVESRVREELRSWWGAQVDRWQLLARYSLPRALPLQRPETTEPMTRPVRLSARRYVCGAHRETSSIGGAMRSGRRAAAAVARELGS